MSLGTGCSTILAQLAATVNGVSDDTTDFVPSILLFESADCGGAMWPSGFVTNPFSAGDTLTYGGVGVTHYPFTPASFIIPFNYTAVGFNGNSGATEFFGPWYVSNVQDVSWPDGKTMLEEPVTSIDIAAIQPWNAAVLSMCMGERLALLYRTTYAVAERSWPYSVLDLCCAGTVEYIGTSPLSRYYGQTPRCDYFMGSQYCINANLQTKTACGCFLELPGIEAESKTLGVDLPIICFGQVCSSENTYKTLNMLNKPCNITICAQIISSTPGIVNEGEDTVYCAGQFFKSTGTIAPPSISPPPPVGSGGGNEDIPFYVWIMLGVSAILFAVLVYLLFSEKPKKETSVLRQIRKIAASTGTRRTANALVSKPQ